MYKEDKYGNSIAFQDNGLLLITPNKGSTRALSIAEVVSAVTNRDGKDAVRILNKLVTEGVDHNRAIGICYERNENEEGIAAALEEAAEYFGITGYYAKLVSRNEQSYPQLVPEE